jgi:transposase
MKLKYEDKLKIIEMKQKGYPTDKICNLFNIKKDSIYRVINAYSLDGRDGLFRPLRSQHYPPEEKLEIVKKYLKGDSYLELCAIHKISNRGTIANWVKKYSEEGYNGLTGKQGRPCKYMKKNESKIEPIDASTTTSKKDLVKENKKLKKENEYLRAKMAYEKKLDALVREREARETMKKH